MRFPLILPLASALTLSACLPPHPPPAPPPPEVAQQSAVVPLAQVSPVFVNRYLGTFHNGGRTLTIRRLGDALFADAAPLTLVGLGTFTDASGSAYLFVPADGNGSTLRVVAPDGTSRDWVR